MQTRSFEFGIDDFITPLYNSAVRERDKPGEDISFRWQTIFQKIFKKPSYFIYDNGVNL